MAEVEEGGGGGAAPFGMPSSGGELGERDETIESIVQTVHDLFTAFSNCDASRFASLVDHDARFVRTGYTEDGSPDVTSYPKEYFVATLSKAQKGMLEERIFQPFVQHRDTMAHVWCRSTHPVLHVPKRTRTSPGSPSSRFGSVMAGTRSRSGGSPSTRV